MKRILFILLTLFLLVCCLSASAATAVYSTSYSEQFILGYSWSTGKSTGTTHAYRIFFKNPAQRSMTAYKLTMWFYDAYGALVNTESTDWQAATVESGKGSWTPFLETEQRTASFEWRLTYRLTGSSSDYNSPVSSVATAQSNTWLLQCQAWNNANQRTVEYGMPSSVALTETSFQYEYLFNINSTTGAVKDSLMYFRTYLKNRGANKITGYDMNLICYDANGNPVGTVSSGWQDCSLKNTKGGWSKWLSVPLTTERVTNILSYVCD